MSLVFSYSSLFHSMNPFPPSMPLLESLHHESHLFAKKNHNLQSLTKAKIPWHSHQSDQTRAQFLCFRMTKEKNRHHRLKKANPWKENHRARCVCSQTTIPLQKRHESKKYSHRWTHRQQKQHCAMKKTNPGSGNEGTRMERPAYNSPISADMVRHFSLCR